MSEEALKLIHEVEESLAERLSRSAKLLYLLGGMLVAGAVWATTQQLTVTKLAKSEETQEQTIRDLSNWRIAVESSAYTMRDHAENEKARLQRDTAANELMNERNLLQEKRLQRLEDNQARLIDIVERLEQKP